MKFVAMMMVAGVGVGAVGCAAETSAPPEEKVGQTSQALTNAQQSQIDATSVVKAILSQSLTPIPAGCTALQADLQTLFSDMAAGGVTITNNGPVTVLGLRAIGYRVTDAINDMLPFNLADDADVCYPNDYYIYNFLYSNTGTSAGIVMDPEPAQLTQNLSSSRGSSAAATDTTTNATVTAWQWPSSPSTGGSFAGAEPCSSVALSAGQTTSANIQKSGSSLQYSACK